MKPPLILFVLFCLICSVESTAQNSAPYALYPKSRQTVPGAMTCVTVKTADVDPSDTVRISWSTAVQTATFAHNSGAVQHASGEFCWTPTNSDPRHEPYLFFITLDDGHVQVVDTFYIWVRGIPERDSFQITKGTCGERIFYTTFNEWTNQVAYVFYHDGEPFYSTTEPGIALQKLKPGTYVVSTNLQSTTPVFNRYLDTFYVTEGHDVTSKFEKLFEPNEYRVTLTEHSGNPNVHYSWTLENSLGIHNLPDTLMQLTAQVWEPSYLCVYISSDQNCADTLCYTLSFVQNSFQDIEEQAHIFPNPCVDQLNIDARKPILSLTLFDIQGKQVLQQEEAETLTTQLQLNDLPKGTYLLAIRFMDGSTGHHAVVVR